uniref:Kazal-like domain-containing protein n=1 Tax=Terrapene triunguis TaxID=2587831 RepID=A0A674I6P8_9SAUR
MYFIFLCCTLLQHNSLTGYYTYRPKYIKQQYGQSASKSNFIIGEYYSPIFLVRGKCFEPVICGRKACNSTKLLLMILFTFCIFTLLCFVLGYENCKAAGLTVTYDGYGDSLNPIKHHENSSFSVCSFDCKCATNQWDPVCGNKGITYMTACLAECKALTGQGQNIVKAFPSILCLQTSNC